MQQVKADAKRFRAISEIEQTVCSNKWIVQVLGIKSEPYHAYFSSPPAGLPDQLFDTRLEALRNAVDQARK